MIRGLCAALAAAFLFPAAASARTDVDWQVTLEWPAQGTVTSPFGRDGYRWHPGLDIGILQSLSVTAAAPGRVTDVGYLAGYDGYGAVVVIEHRNGYSTLYAHLSQPLVRRGQLVWTGERIGIAGCTGWCTGTHLHFELRHRDVAMDPSFLLVG